MLHACCACGGGRHFTIHGAEDCKCNADYYDDIPGKGVRCVHAPRFYFKSKAKCQLQQMKFGMTQSLQLEVSISHSQARTPTGRAHEAYVGKAMLR